MHHHSFLRRLWRAITIQPSFTEIEMSAKTDALAAAVTALEAQVATNTTAIAGAAQLFKDNAAAAVQLAADEAAVASLTDRISVASAQIASDDAALAAAQTPAPTDTPAAPAAS